MEKIALRQRRTCDGIHRLPQPTVLFDQKSLEPATDLMGTGVDELQLQNSLPTGKLGRETRRVESTAGVPS